MGNNNNLNVAKADRFDEFYTQYSDIEAELQHYDFKNKTVYCPCDDPSFSNFYKYFSDNKAKLGIRDLLYSFYNQETKTGDFRSTESQQLFQQADIIVTNPPFSLFKEFMQVVFNSKKDFIILGPLNAVKYRNIFPRFVSEEIKLGVNHGSMKFRVPDNFQRNNVREIAGQRFATFGNIVWFTNLPVNRQPLALNTKYHPLKHFKYDNYDAIDIPKVAEIPDNYPNYMGVPITYLQFHDPSQFQIICMLNTGSPSDPYDLAKPLLRDKQLFTRILIRRRHDE